MSASTPAQILAILGPSCRDNVRRQLLLAQNVLNGIDYVEFEMVAATPTLHVHFLNAVPAGAWGLTADPSPIEVHGGTRIVGVRVVSAAVTGTRLLDVVVDQQGDFSPYLLTIGWQRADAGNWVYAFADLDRLFSVAPVNFRPGCPVDFDCKPGEDCPPDTLAEPALDYLARDYASFRQLLIDLVSERSPTWRERSPADLGITLLELFATEGDHIAYLQDAVANEAYLDTTRQRESAKRHARLIDYRMHDGRNARTWVQFRVTGQGVIGKDIQLVTRISAPLRFNRPGAVPAPDPGRPPETELNPPSEYEAVAPFVVYDDYDADPALQPVRVFETTSETTVDELCNTIRIHTWGNERCCLPRGTTSAHVFSISGPQNQRTAIRPPLKAGDLLLLEEVRDPGTGAEADADPAHRQVVEVVRVSPYPPTTTGPVSDQLHDQLYLAALGPNDTLVKVTAPVPIASTLPLLEVAWRPVDALTFPLCLSSVLDDGTAVEVVAFARGNIAGADHGRRITDGVEFAPAFSGDRARVPLTRGPLTMACAAGSPVCTPEDAWPAIDRNEVRVRRAAGGTEPWTVVRDLLDSDDTDANVVVDVDAKGRPTLRFGDAEYGRRLVDAGEVSATYRIGSGRAGNIGAEGLYHVVVPNPKPPTWPTKVMYVRNPLPASGGVDAETIEEVRQRAPAAFRATQFRAVTEDDYRKAALTAKGVAGAVASFRWTGSWYTAFVGIDPADPDMVLTDARGHTRLLPAFRDSVLDVLNRYRLAGYDLEVRSARYVPLDIAIQLCLKAGYFRGDVVEAAIEALAGRRPGTATKPGLFDPANLTFAQPVYLSQVYAAVEAVEGVDSAEVLVFRRHGRLPAGELEQGFIPVGAWEIAQLDNDPSRMENGSLTVTAAGGS